MQINEQFGVLASNEAIEKAIKSLEDNGIKACSVESLSRAKDEVLKIIPEGSEVMTMTSVTLDSSGISKELNDSGKYKSIKVELGKLKEDTQKIEANRLGAAHQYSVGSAHAVTQDGKILVASATGSQLGPYSYGASNVILVVGSQKVVKDFDEGLKRIYEYSLPFEDERARKVYGMGSGVNKILVINKEFNPGRITVIIVKEKVGF